jgi:hypothetical protein
MLNTLDIAQVLTMKQMRRAKIAFIHRIIISYVAKS